MREQKVFKFWIVEGQDKPKWFLKFKEEFGRNPTEEEEKRFDDNHIDYEGEKKVYANEIDNYLTKIFSEGSNVLEIKYVGYEIEKLYTKEELDDEIEDALLECHSKLSSISDYLDNIESHLDDLKSTMSDLDYYVDEAQDDIDNAKYEMEEIQNDRQ